MLKKCNIVGCRGYYKNEPYIKNVQFPTDEVEQNRWIDAMPNERSSLLKLKEIYARANYFNYNWTKVGSGKRPSGPPSMFLGVPQSCLKQIPSVQIVSAEARTENEQLRAETMDIIGSFSSFCDAIMKRFSRHHHIICSTGRRCLVRHPNSIQPAQIKAWAEGLSFYHPGLLRCQG